MHVLIVPAVWPFACVFVLAPRLPFIYIVIELYGFFSFKKYTSLTAVTKWIHCRRSTRKRKLCHTQYLLQNSKLHFQVGIYRATTTRTQKPLKTEYIQENQEKKTTTTTNAIAENTSSLSIEREIRVTRFVYKS